MSIGYNGISVEVPPWAVGDIVVNGLLAGFERKSRTARPDRQHSGQKKSTGTKRGFATTHFCQGTLRRFYGR